MRSPKAIQFQVLSRMYSTIVCMHACIPCTYLFNLTPIIRLAHMAHDLFMVRMFCLLLLGFG